MKPSMVINYNKYMGRDDRSDQMISYTNSIVKSFKWWKKVIFHVLAIVVLDAYILFKSQNPNSVITDRVFRKKLMHSIGPFFMIAKSPRFVKTWGK
jgi:hypothetical protein